MCVPFAWIDLLSHLPPTQGVRTARSDERRRGDSLFEARQSGAAKTEACRTIGQYHYPVNCSWSPLGLINKVEALEQLSRADLIAISCQPNLRLKPSQFALGNPYRPVDAAVGHQDIGKHIEVICVLGLSCARIRQLKNHRSHHALPGTDFKRLVLSPILPACVC